jgi:hypothetical protein
LFHLGTVAMHQPRVQHGIQLKSSSRTPLTSRVEWAHRLNPMWPTACRKCATPQWPPCRCSFALPTPRPQIGHTAHRRGGPGEPPVMRLCASYCGSSWGMGGGAALPDSRQPCSSPCHTFLQAHGKAYMQAFSNTVVSPQTSTACAFLES